MGKRQMKYNPSFLSEAELMESFVVRHEDLHLITGIIGENQMDSNQHILVIGPRGSGKTTLVHRVAIEIKRNEELRDLWYPLIFSEESYEVVSAGEFWLEALFHLSEQTDDEKWKQTYDELKAEADDQRLFERALAQLLDFADSQGKRILLIVENLNMLLGNMMSPDEAWKMRHTLMNEPRMMLLATATSRFEQIENSSHAMFEMFKMQELKPLDDDECNRIWEFVAGEKLTGERIKPIRILTGGNPRLLTIIAKFGAHRSFRNLLDDLVHLIDDHTEYFKSHLDNLPTIERKAYLALAGLWDASTAREVARAARLDVNKTSSLLRRLIGRGAVVVEDRGKKIKWYSVAERMYNIYYLMRRRGKPSDRVKATVKFMISMYDPESAARLIAEEAIGLSPEICNDHYLAYEETIREVSNRQLLERIIASTPKHFLESPYISEALRDIVQVDQEVVLTEEANLKRKTGFSEIEGSLRTMKLGFQLLRDGKSEQAIEKFDQVVENLGNIDGLSAHISVATALNTKIIVLLMLCRWEKALSVCDEVIAFFESAEEKELCTAVAEAMVNKGNALRNLNLFEDAIEIYDEVTAKFGEEKESTLLRWVLLARVNKSNALVSFERFEDAIAICDEVISRFGETKEAILLDIVLRAMVNKGSALIGLGHFEDAISVYNRVIATIRETKEAAFRRMELITVLKKGEALEKSNKLEDAIELYDEVIAGFGEKEEKRLRSLDLAVMIKKGEALKKLNKLEDAISIYDEIIAEFEETKDPLLLDFFIMAMADKGDALIGLKHYQDAIAVIDELISQLSVLQHSHLVDKVKPFILKLKAYTLDLRGQYEEARKAILQVIELDPEDDEANLHFFELLLKMSKRVDEAIRMAEKIVSRKPKDAHLLNGIAWQLYMHGDLSLLLEAEKWSLKAVSLEPEKASAHLTLACILNTLGKGEEALQSAERYIQDASLVESTIEDAIELFVALAAAGYAKEALGLLVHSPARKHLEPLEVGLRMFIGEDVKTASEIREVAKDVVKLIEDRLKKR